MDFRNSQFHFYKRSFCQTLTPLPLFEKVIPAIRVTSTSCHIIRTIIFHFTDGEGLLVNYRKFLLYHRFPVPIDFKSCCEEIAGALQEFCNRWCKREHVESNALNSWKLFFF